MNVPLKSIRHVLVGAGVAVCLSANLTLAAEKVRINYGPISRSLPVSDLRQFAETGKTTRKLRSYLKRAKQDPDQIQAALTRSTTMNPVQLDRLLNSVPGELLLKEAGDVIHTPADRANHQALRSALILDASRDQQITLIDTLEEYPTPEVEVEGDRLVKLIRQFNQLKAYGEDAQPIVEGLGKTGVQPLLNILRDQLGPLLR
ncbi:MAG: alpha/beta hydrolase [Thermosynechococcaceae cyanobacterium]